MVERPLRVAFLNHVARMGGGEHALLSILQRLDGRSVQPLAVLGEEGRLAERLRAIPVAVEIHPLAPAVLNRRKDALGAAGLAHPVVLARSAAAVVGLARLLRRSGADIVHTNSLKAHLLGGLAGRLAGARVVWHVRDHVSSPYLPSAAVPVVRAAARALPHRVLAVSASAAATTGRRDAVVVHQDVQIPPDAGPRPSGGPLRIGLVGRIAPWKGQDVFLAAAARLAPEFPGARFVIAGAPLFGEEGFERGLRERASAPDLVGRVDFAGFREDVWAVYRDLDVVVHASALPEPYGNVILEAMASRRPIVAAAAGGVLELVEDGRTGVLVPPGDPDALAEALRRLLRSPDERRRLADAGRRRVQERFSSGRDIELLERVWRDLAAGAGRRRMGRRR